LDLKAVGFSDMDWIHLTLVCFMNMRDSKFSRRWRFKSRCSGLWRRVVLW